MIRTKAQKQEMVTALATRLRRASTIYVTDFTGLDVAKITQLRRRLRQAGEAGSTDFVVVKNTLARRASVFFTTTKSVPPPANRSRRRNWVILATSSPVKSVTYTVEALRSRVASAVTISCFSAFVRIMRTPPDPRGLPVP